MTNRFIVPRSRITAVMTLILSALTLFACFIGIFNTAIYGDVLNAGTITRFLQVGSVAQDIIFIPQAVILAALSVIFLIRPQYKIFIIMLGFTGNFFYGYGLYAMQGQYSSIYLVYLAVFGLSIYSIVLGLLSFNREFEAKLSIPKGLRISVSIFLYFVVVMLGFIWIIRMSPDIDKHVPQDAYGVFILDLGIVFPALAIASTRLIGKKPFGIIFSGVALMKALTVCLSWGFGEWYGRIKGTVEGSYDLLMIPTVLTLISLVFCVLYILKIREKA